MGAILLKNIVVEGVASDVLLEGGLIGRIVPSGEQIVLPEDVEVVDCEGKTLMPGFINMHTHAGMTLMRGAGEDMPLHDWLDKIWTLEKDLDE